MRIMAFNGKLEHADHFGMDEYSYKQFAPLLNYPNGIIYITGPTGSGKSTTLYMILEYLTGRNINISTIEDPVEKNLPGINQTQVLSLIHISEPTRRTPISYAVFCLKKKNKKNIEQEKVSNFFLTTMRETHTHELR